MLNIVSQGGDFDPFVKFNAKAGRWYIRQSDQDVEVLDPVFVADFDNIKTGWLLFLEGQAPSKVWDESLTVAAEKPSEKHKRGFSLRLFSNNSFGGVVELSSSSMHLCSAINDLYTIYEEQRGANAGMLPVVKYTGSSPMKDKMGTNYRPNFIIEKWVPRPAELDSEQDAPAQPAPQPAQPVQPQPVAASGGSEF